MTKEAAEKQLSSDGLIMKTEDIQITKDDKYYPLGYVVKQAPTNGSSQVPEGTEVTVYVCSGYKCDVEVDFPRDMAIGIYEISLWNNGQLFNKGATVDVSKLAAYTFKDLVSTETELELDVVIKAQNGSKYDLCVIKINNKTGKALIDGYIDYPEMGDIEDDTSSDNNSSDSNGDSTNTGTEDDTQTDNTGGYGAEG